MKSLVESIQQINEGLCKDLYKIRKGQQVYVIGETGTKAKLVTVEDVIKSERLSNISGEMYLNISVKLEDNEWTNTFNMLIPKDTTEKLYATYCTWFNKGYIGVSKEAIHALRSSNNKPRIDQYSKAIEQCSKTLQDTQKKLDELMCKKQELEETISAEISESIK